MYQFLLVASFLASGFTWKLESNQIKVNSGNLGLTADNTTLRCFNEQPDNARLAKYDQVTGIRILKKDSSDSWNVYAEVTPHNAAEVKITQSDTSTISVSGHVGRSAESYLSVTWSKFSAEMLGKYSCEVDLNNTIEDVYTYLNTKEVSITDDMTMRDLLGILIQWRQESKAMSESLGEEQQSFKKQVQDLFMRQYDCPKGLTLYQDGNGKTCLKKFDQLVTWQEARKLCQGFGGDLVKITSASMNSFVKALPGPKTYWIGLNDIVEEGTFVWLDEKSPALFTSWNLGEPNNAGVENCVAFSPPEDQWNDVPCHRQLPYVCQSPSKHTCTLN